MITVSDVCAGYGEEEILHNINTAFEDGKVTAVIGPNGCGKSTLLKTLIRIIAPSSGEILFDGTPQRKLNSRELAQRVAYMPQSRNVPEITVERMVMHGRFPYLSYPRHYRREDMRIVKEALERTGTQDLADHMVGQLSGGQRQKVYIAMALAQDTGAVLMDEPTTYLDISNQIELMETAAQLSGDGKAVIIVMHDLDAVLRYADHVVLMKNGRIICEGIPEDVYRSGFVEEAFGVKPHIIEEDDGIHCYCTKAAKQDLLS